MRELLIDYIDELLTRYTDDEVGKELKQRYLDMNDEKKLILILSTMYKEIGKSDDLEDILDNLDTNIIINFDFGNY